MLPAAAASLIPMEEKTSFIDPAGKELLHGASQSIISSIAGSKSGCLPCSKPYSPSYFLGMLAASMYVANIGNTSSSVGIMSLEAVRGSIQSLAHIQSLGRYDGAPVTWLLSVRCFRVGALLQRPGCGADPFNSRLHDLRVRVRHPRVAC